MGTARIRVVDPKAQTEISRDWPGNYRLECLTRGIEHLLEFVDRLHIAPAAKNCPQSLVSASLCRKSGGGIWLNVRKPAREDDTIFVEASEPLVTFLSTTCNVSFGDYNLSRRLLTSQSFFRSSDGTASTSQECNERLTC